MPTMGSRGFWERLQYDWSDPHHVVLTTTDSNVWGGRSGYTDTFPRQPDGTTTVEVVMVREGKNFNGRIHGAVLGSVGRAVLAKALPNTVHAIEARAAGSEGKEGG